MGEGDSNTDEGAKVEAISLDDWQPKPVSLDAWAVDEAKPVGKAPAPAEPQAISLADWQPKPVSLDEWAPAESAVEVKEEVDVEIPSESSTVEIEAQEEVGSGEEPISLGAEDLVLEPSEEAGDEPISLGEEDLAPSGFEGENNEDLQFEVDDTSIALDDSLELDEEVGISDDIDTSSLELRTQTEQLEVESLEPDPEPLESLETLTPEPSMDEAMIPSMAMPGVPMGIPIGEEVPDDEPLTDTEEVASVVETVTLGEADLAINHLPPVVRLLESDLREKSQLAVIRLAHLDLADEHRVVFDLEPTFFEEHGIAVNSNGVILLEAMDLAHADEDEEDKPSRSRRRTREVKESYWTNERISKFSIYAIIFCLFAIPTVYHFKYTWTTVGSDEYAEIKEDTGGVDWVMKTMFKYRTSDSSFRWFGRRLLNPQAYQRAEQEKSMLWLRYVNSGQAGQGDSALD